MCVSLCLWVCVCVWVCVCPRMCAAEHIFVCIFCLGWCWDDWMTSTLFLMAGCFHEIFPKELAAAVDAAPASAGPRGECSTPTPPLSSNGDLNSIHKPNFIFWACCRSNLACLGIARVNKRRNLTGLNRNSIGRNRSANMWHDPTLLIPLHGLWDTSPSLG